MFFFLSIFFPYVFEISLISDNTLTHCTVISGDGTLSFLLPLHCKPLKQLECTEIRTSGWALESPAILSVQKTV